MSFFTKVLYRIIVRFDQVSAARFVGVKVGKNCRFLNRIIWGSEPYLIEVGDHVMISTDVNFITHDGGTFVFREKEPYKGVLRFGPITIGNNCFVGQGARILPNVTIGDNCIVGAGALVTKSIPSGEVWGGVPAHFITKTEDFAKKCMEETPDYSQENIKIDKRKELLRIFKGGK